MNIPNYSQSARIRSDIQALQNGKTPADWQGNSYYGLIGYESDQAHLYTLIHWQTPICQIRIAKDGDTRVLFFNARYISSTTRSFQGRIVNSLRTALGANNPDVLSMARELAKSTADRDVLKLTMTPEMHLRLISR